MPKSRLARVAAPLFLLVLGSEAIAGDDHPDVATVGPAVGERVPDFVLSDQAGRERTLDSLMGPDGLVLVFYRSADW